MAGNGGRKLWGALNVLAAAGIVALTGYGYLQGSGSTEDPAATGQRIVYSTEENAIVSAPVLLNKTEPEPEEEAKEKSSAPDKKAKKGAPPDMEGEENTPPGMPPLPDGADEEGGFLEESAAPAKPKAAAKKAAPAKPSPEESEGSFLETEPEPAPAPRVAAYVEPKGEDFIPDMDQYEGGALPEQDVPPVDIKTVPREKLVDAGEHADDKPQGFARTTLPDLPERSGSSVTMASVPNAQLEEKTAAGAVPMKGSDGTEPWRYYARPFTHKGKEAPVAIIIADLGMNRTLTDTALRLPEEVTVAVNAYAPNADGWLKKAREMGHETLLQLALQPADYPYTDPGPQALLIDTNPVENKERLLWSLARGAGYIGVLAPPDEVFTEAAAASDIFRNSGERGLAFVRATPDNVETVGPTAKALNARFINAGVLIDAQVSQDAIKKKLQALEQQAKKQGHAVGVARPYALSLNQLNQWFKDMKKKGLVLAPVSVIANDGKQL